MMMLFALVNFKREFNYVYVFSMNVMGPAQGTYFLFGVHVGFPDRSSTAPGASFYHIFMLARRFCFTKLIFLFRFTSGPPLGRLLVHSSLALKLILFSQNHPT